MGLWMSIEKAPEWHSAHSLKRQWQERRPCSFDVTNILTNGQGASWKCRWNSKAADVSSPTEPVQPGTWKAASPIWRCACVEASDLAGTAAPTSAGDNALQHTTTMPKTYTGMNLTEPPFFASFCAKCCVCWLPLLSVILNSFIKSSFHQYDVTLHFFFLNSQPDYMLLKSCCMS